MTDPLLARLLIVVEASPLSQVAISRAAGQRATWLGDHLQAWRGRGRRGGEPTLATLRLLARGLGVSLGDLLGEELLAERD
jgi:hypothetical protein